MIDREMERRHLGQAARHIAEFENKVTQQEARVAELDRDGLDTTEALKLLENFRDVLEQARVHKDIIVDQLEAVMD